MGLFRPLDESVGNAEMSQSKFQQRKNLYAKVAKQRDDVKKTPFVHKQFEKSSSLTPSKPSILTTAKDKVKNAASYIKNKFQHESTAALLGISDEELYDLNEGNCNSDTCKCKGGTCPVEVTDGISTSSYAAKKLASAGSNNQTDLNAVKPNAEYSRQNDALFIGDGDSPETSKTNIPAILAAKTAGGSPHGWTTDNGINGTGPNVFKLKKLKDDDDGPNG